jgi:hypothetical protein
MHLDVGLSIRKESYGEHELTSSAILMILLA